MEMRLTWLDVQIFLRNFPHSKFPSPPFLSYWEEGFVVVGFILWVISDLNGYLSWILYQPSYIPYKRG